MGSLLRGDFVERMLIWVFGSLSTKFTTPEEWGKCGYIVEWELSWSELLWLRNTRWSRPRSIVPEGRRAFSQCCIVPPRRGTTAGSRRTPACASSPPTTSHSVQHSTICERKHILMALTPILIYRARLKGGPQVWWIFTPLWKGKQDRFWIPARIPVANDQLGSRLQ